MKKETIPELVIGKHYLVTNNWFNSTKTTKARRIFKGEEKRFNSIPCFVFTSRVNKDVTMKKRRDYFIFTGKRIPSTEISIPHYCIINIKELIT
jgi:hypothetical protein